MVLFRGEHTLTEVRVHVLRTNVITVFVNAMVKKPV